MSEQKTVRSYQDLLNADPVGDDYGAALRETLGASDRAMALVCVAHLDVRIQTLISISMKNIDDNTISRLSRQGGPFSTFSNKVTLAYALGLIERNDMLELDVIRKIRNAFAHSALALNLQEPALSSMCLGLDIARAQNYFKDTYGSEVDPDVSLSKERQQLLYVSLFYVSKLSRKSQQLLNEKLETLKSVEESIENMRKITGFSS